MEPNQAPSLPVLFLRLLISSLIAAPMLWVSYTLNLGAAWYMFLTTGIFISLTSSNPMPGAERNPPWMAVFAACVATGFVFYVTLETPDRVVSLVAAVLTFGILYGLSYIYPREDAPTNLTMAAVSVGLTLLLSNVLAGVYLRAGEQANAAEPTSAPEVEPAIPSEDVPSVEEAPIEETETPAEESTPKPEPELTELPDEVVEPEPETEEAATDQPIPGWGYQEFIEDGGEVSWNYLTGFGPRANTLVRNYMVDANGEMVYDTTVRYNEYGMRGLAVPYEKPDDTYRILIIGDSFVEAIQADYEDTFPAVLQSQLNDAAVEQRFEVIAMGRTGWGTLHEYLFYHHKGHKFNADLVVLSFFINDVADNYPIFFYPGINNTNFEFVFTEESLQIVDTNQQPLPPNATRILYNALPSFLRNSALARLGARIGDPPIPVITPGTVLERVHPQYYIYVTEPEVEGYAEAWERTERGIQLLADEVQANGGQLVIMPIFLGSEQVANVSTWWPELVEGWQWDDTLPEQTLAEIADRTGADLALTRPVYEAYADEVDGQVYDLIYLPEDGHFNALGHQLTADVLFQYLVEAGVVE